MQIGVIGTGAIGGTIAALLDRAGHDVEVTARGDQLRALRADGIQLDGKWGDHTARVIASPTLGRKPDLAFVCTKAQDADEAIRANAAQLSGIPVVIVQNGLTGLDRAAALLPSSTCIGALALYAASYTTIGRVTVTTAANTYLGSGTGKPSPAAIDAVRILDGAMPAVATSNFLGSQWTKLIVNQVNAMPAITGLHVQATIASPLLRPVITAGMREAVRIGFARGIRYGSIQGLTNGALRLMAHSPVRIAEVVPQLMRRRMGDVPNPGSTLQSIRRQAPTEIDYLNGAVVDQAALAGLRAPINAELVRMVHAVEASGEFLAPGDVVDGVMRALHPRG